MSLRKLPVIEQRIRLTAELFQGSNEHAITAQANEELIGDLVVATEMSSEMFQANYPRLSSLHSTLIELYGLGFVPLAYVTNMSMYLDRFILDEFENLRYRSQLLDLEAFYDNLHAYHSIMASNLDISLITLLAIRDELLLRAQGNQATPLADLNLDSD